MSGGVLDARSPQLFAHVVSVRAQQFDTYEQRDLGYALFAPDAHAIGRCPPVCLQGGPFVGTSSYAAVVRETIFEALVVAPLPPFERASRIFLGASHGSQASEPNDPHPFLAFSTPDQSAW